MNDDAIIAIIGVSFFAFLYAVVRVITTDTNVENKWNREKNSVKRK
jgi:hypothetical protein